MIRIPVQHPFIFDVGRYVYRVVLTLDIDTGQRTAPMPFRLDTGSDFTTVPMDFADALGIPYPQTMPVYPDTAAGTAAHPSYLTRIWFSFPAVPHLQFESNCLISPYPMRRGLLSLNDVLPQFHLRSHDPSPGYPNGSITFDLRPDHTGWPRS